MASIMWSDEWNFKKGGRRMNTPRWIYVQLHLLVALFATTAVLGHLISISATSLVIWRSALAICGGAVLVVATGRGNILPSVRCAVSLIGIGVIVGLHWMCFFGAIKLANISICLAGMATTSFFTAFTEPFFEKRRIRPLEVWLGLLVLAGIVMVAGFERGRLSGLVVALAGAFLAAVFPVLNRRMVRRDQLDPVVMVVWEMVGVFLVCMVALPWVDGAGAYGRLMELHGWDWLWLVLLAWACTVFAHAFHIHLLRYLSAYTGNLAINFEPVYGIVAAAVLFAEHRQLHPGFFVGAGAIILANIAHPLVLRELSARKQREGDGSGIDCA